MNASRRVSLLFCAVFLFVFFSAAGVQGAAFTPGNLVLYRVNDGAAALSANGTAVFLDEYTTAGVLVQSIAVPTTTVAAQRRLVCSGTATTEGFLSRSTDGQYVVFSGYDAALGTASITTSTSATVPRVIGRVGANGVLDTSTALTDAISGGNPRGAASTDGTNLWLSGTSGGGGIRYATFGATTSTSLTATPTNLRVPGIFGNQLYVSSQSGAFRLATVGSGTPTTTGQTTTNLPGFPTATGSPYGFFFADLNAGVAGVDTVYVADDGGTVQKYSLVGGNWTANGTIALTTARGITGSVSGSNVTLYVTARTTLRTLTDTSGYNATITGTVTTLATAATNTAMQGVAFVPQAIVANQPVVPNCPSPITTNAGTATTGGVSATDADGTVTSATITGITPSDPGTITLTGFTPAGAVGGTATATVSVSAATPANTYTVTIQWANNDGSPQTANCNVSVVVNAPPTIAKIHDVQGNTASTPSPGTTYTIEGIVIGDFQPIPNDNRLSGFFVQEEDADVDADPNTSEGIFVFCSACPTDVAEGQKVQVTGTSSEFFNNTQLTATTAGSVVITNAGNNLAQVTATAVNLPVVGVINDFYERMENMLVTYIDTLTVSEYFEQYRYGRVELFEGGRPRQFAEANAPSTPGYTAHNDTLDRRRVILDDDDNVENSVLNLPNGQQFVFHPRANGGLSVGTQGPDFFRGGDTISNLTGILHWSFGGGPSPDEWRIRPVAAAPAVFTPVNTRPATPPTVGGAIRVASTNVLNYFTTLNQRGADSTAELNRQRERLSIVLCDLNADVAALMEIENHATNATITDLLGAVNTRCAGTHPYTFVNTGGALGTDEIRVMIIYRSGVVSPVGAPLVDMNAVHNRPPTAQTFDVVDVTNPAFGQRFTVLANHSKSKGCGSASGGDLDANDGQACYSDTREAQATRLLTWVNGTVIPAAGDPDVMMLGDFNAYPKETSTTILTTGGYTDLEDAFLGANAYSYLFDGQIGHIDYAFASTSLTPQVTGTAPWHINADENPLFDYNDEIKDGAAEQAFEEKPDGSALVPPRVVFQAATRYRASDHDPVIAGLFAVSDLAITKTDSPDPVTAGNNLTYTITVSNNGPDAAANASWTDNLTDSTFVSLSAVAGWSCTTPAVGATGTITCNNATFAVGNAVFTLVTNVPASTASGTVLSNTASVTSNSAEGNPGNESATATTTVAASANLTISKTDTPDPVTAGNNISYQITITNSGPSNAASATFSDTLPAGTTFVSLSTTGAWSCTTPAVGATGTVSCSNGSFPVTVDFFTLVVKVDASTAAGTVLSNTATVGSSTSDPSPGDESATATTTVATSADLSVTKTDSPDPVNAGANITYTITVTNAGPSNASTVSLSDTLPAGTEFISLSSPAGWSCTTPGVNGVGTVSCSNASMNVGSDVFTLVVYVTSATTSGTVISNSATVSSTTSDPNSGNETGSATTTVSTASDMSIAKLDSPDPVTAGNNLTYTIQVTNSGPSNSANPSFSDTLPAGTTFVSITTAGSYNCTTPAVGANGTVTCSAPNQVAGTMAPFTLVVNVSPSVAAGTVLSNTVNLTQSTTDPNPGNESATATTTVATSAEVSVTKTDSPDPVTAGNNLTYTITINNAGPSNASTVTLSDNVPANTTFVSFSSPGGWSCTTPAVGGTGAINCSATTLAPGNAVFTLVVNVNAATAAGTILSNTASIGSTNDVSGANNSDTETTTVGAGSADLSVAKTDSPDPVTAGTNLTYTITVNNAGPSNAATVALADTVPANTTFVSLASPGGWSCTAPSVGGTGAISCSIATLAPGNAVFTLVVNVNAGTADGTVLSNTATVSSTTSDPNSGNESDTETTTVGTGSADLSVTKTDSPDPVTPGTNLTYTITVNNAGPSSATSASLLDAIPAGTTFVSLSSPGGWSCTTPAVGGTGNVSCSAATMIPGNAVFTLVVLVNPSATGTVSNTVTVTSSTTDPSTGNESDTENTTIGAASANLTVTKTDSPDPVTPGTNLTYTVNVNNAGPSNAATLSLSDGLPAGTTFVSLSSPGGWSCTTPAVGATGTVTCTAATLAPGNAAFTLVVNVGAQVATGTILSNTATVTSATADPSSGDESDTETTTVGAGSANLSVTKTDSPDPVAPAGNLTYTITINNAGPSNAANVSLTDNVPTGTTFVSLSSPGGWSCTNPAVGGTGPITCSLVTMPVGNAVFTLVVNANPSLTTGTTITNTATVTSTTADPATGNESATATTTVGSGSADLSVTKVDTPDPVLAGSNITYTITVNNAGPANATSASLSDTIPANTTFVSLASAAGWSCTTPSVGGTGTVSCTNASMASGNAVFTLVVNVNGGTANGTVITNTATASSATTDPNPGNESGTATTTVTVTPTSADLSVTKTDSPDPVAPGGNITYTITVNNAGPDAATTASLSDNVPTNTTFVSLAAAAGWSCSTPAPGGTGLITCSNASMAVGSGVFTLVVNVNAGTANGTVITNSATISSATTEGNPGNETATATTTVNSAATGANVTGTKTASGTRTPGSTLTYTITLTNSGPGAQADNPGNEFIDVLPAQLTLVSASANSGTAVATIATNTVTWNGPIPAGGSVTITIQAIIDPAATPGTTITNQGTINYDADGNGTNEASNVTDDPGAAGGGNSTAVVVAPAATGIGEVPALDGAGLLALAALLAALGVFVMRRS